jgi:hypothetical protein
MTLFSLAQELRTAMGSKPIRFGSSPIPEARLLALIAANGCGP